MTLALSFAVLMTFFSPSPAGAQANLIEFAKPELGFALLVPGYFTSLEKIEGSDSIFTFSGFNGRASIQVRTATLRKPITPEELGAVYQRKVLSEAIEVTGGSWIDISGVQSLRKVYTLSEQAAPGRTLDKVIVTVLYAVANDRFYVFQVSNLETIDWPERTSVLESFDLFSSSDRNYPAASIPGAIGNSGSTGGIAPLTVNSHPEGAKIFLNGAFAGNTPLMIRVDRVGAYEVSLSLDGFRPWARTIQVNYDTVAMVDAFLDPADSEEVPISDSSAPQAGRKVYNYGGSAQSVPDRGSLPREDLNDPGDASPNSYNYGDLTGRSTESPIKSLESRLPDDLQRFERVYGDLETEAGYFENSVFHQRRPIQLERKLAKRLKKLDQSVKSASRELVELYGERSGAAELINRYSALQTRVRQMVVLSR